MSGIQIIKNDLTSRLQDILTRGKSTQAMSRVYPLYQKLQTQRFQTENESEGNKWEPLNKEYAAYKLRRYGGGSISRGKKKGQNWHSWPGGGRKMLIGTSTLAGAIIGPGAPFEGTDKHVALFQPWSLQISVASSGTNAEGRPFNYAAFVAEKRPFMSFSQASIQLMRDTLSKFLLKG